MRDPHEGVDPAQLGLLLNLISSSLSHEAAALEVTSSRGAERGAARARSR